MNLLEEPAQITWCWNHEYFLETAEGNYIWSNPDYGGNGTITHWPTDFKDFLHSRNLKYGRDKGERIIGHYCENAVVIPKAVSNVFDKYLDCCEKRRQMTEFFAYLKNGQRILAIKSFRQKMKCDLRTAMEFVDELLINAYDWKKNPVGTITKKPVVIYPWKDLMSGGSFIDCEGDVKQISFHNVNYIGIISTNVENIKIARIGQYSFWVDLS